MKRLTLFTLLLVVACGKSEPKKEAPADPPPAKNTDPAPVKVASKTVTKDLRKPWVIDVPEGAKVDKGMQGDATWDVTVAGDANSTVGISYGEKKYATLDALTKDLCTDKAGTKGETLPDGRLLGRCESKTDGFRFYLVNVKDDPEGPVLCQGTGEGNNAGDEPSSTKATASLEMCKTLRKK